MPVTKSTFGEYELYTIKNSSGAYVRIASLGAAVQSIVVPNRNGAPTDVVLGYDTPGEYLRNDGYFGAFVGRYANRIANAAFMLNGREYKISANEGKNTLHGGNGLSKRRFTETAVGENALTLGISDPDGGDGFPGKVEARVTYEFSEDNELSISYEAVSDADTYLNLTNHSYFNLSGRGDIIDHELMINSDGYLPVDEELIPTGEVCSVSDTKFDFRKMRRIENGFYDHCFVLSGSEPCARLVSKESGIAMTLATDMPAVQFYAGGATGLRLGKGGAVYGKNSACALKRSIIPTARTIPSSRLRFCAPGSDIFQKRAISSQYAEKSTHPGAFFSPMLSSTPCPAESPCSDMPRYSARHARLRVLSRLFRLRVMRTAPG